jgi:hypothetical protein
VYSLAIDDVSGFGESRAVARKRVDHYLVTGNVKTEETPDNVSSINETTEERAERIRLKGVYDPSVQRRWR